MKAGKLHHFSSFPPASASPRTSLSLKKAVSAHRLMRPSSHCNGEEQQGVRFCTRGCWLWKHLGLESPVLTWGCSWRGVAPPSLGGLRTPAWRDSLRSQKVTVARSVPSHQLGPLPSSRSTVTLSSLTTSSGEVSSSHQVPKVLELQLQHLPFQWICFRKWEGSIHESQDKATSRELLSISEIRNYPQIMVGDTQPAWQTSHLHLDSPP